MASRSIGGAVQGVARTVEQLRRAACWTQRKTPDPRLPSGETRFKVLLGRNVKTDFDALLPVLDDDCFRTELDNFVAERQQMFLS